MSSLSSLNHSVKSFINNVDGLAEQDEYIYIDLDKNEYPRKVVKQEKQGNNYSRATKGDTLANYDIFLIDLPIEPRKNDKLTLSSKVFYVDYATKVGIDTYRIYTTENAITIPSRNNRQEI